MAFVIYISSLTPFLLVIFRIRIKVPAKTAVIDSLRIVCWMDWLYLRHLHISSFTLLARVNVSSDAFV